MSPRAWNRRAKSWPGWLLLLFVTVGLLAVGVVRDAGPRTSAERIDDISRRVACPVCDGESVFESRNTASLNIRSEITAQVADGVRTDDEIIEFIADRFGGQILLVPRSTGIEALAWAIPIAALVVCLAGLALAFRRWQVAARTAHGATDADYELVGAALAHDLDEAAADADVEDPVGHDDPPATGAP